MALTEEKLNFLAKVAYETSSGVSTRKADDYFVNDAPTWEELPQRGREYWKNIVNTTFLAYEEMDAGDLVE